MQLDSSQAQVVKKGIKEMFRVPNTTYSILQQSEIADFIKRYCELLGMTETAKKVPPFFLGIAREVMKKSLTKSYGGKMLFSILNRVVK